MIKRIKAAIAAFIEPELLKRKMIFVKEKVHISDSAMLCIGSREYATGDELRINGHNYILQNVYLEITKKV